MSNVTFNDLSDATSDMLASAKSISAESSSFQDDVKRLRELMNELLPSKPIN